MPNSRFVIRSATQDDAETIASFNEAMAWETERKRLDPATIRAGVRAVLTDERKGRYFVACVATNGEPYGAPRDEPGRDEVAATVPDEPTEAAHIGGQGAARVVGQVMHTWEWSDWRNGDVWWLQSVYVAPEFRGQGVFRALLDAVLADARTTPGVVGVRLYVEHENARAQEVYQRLGFANAGYLVLERMPP